jgi:F-type H+-transporting ATPase subunit epsilon
MENPEAKIFHCDVIDPTGKLLDCQTTSVVLPAHDGQLGILYDHMPMLCQLGLGMMKVTVVSADQYKGPSQGDAFFFVDGGFALVASNSLMVVACSAMALQDAKPEKIQLLIEKTEKNLATPTLSAAERAHESERLRALQRIAEALPGT